MPESNGFKNTVYGSHLNGSLYPITAAYNVLQQMNKFSFTRSMSMAILHT
jgi:hypothetical protein